MEKIIRGEKILVLNVFFVIARVEKNDKYPNDAARRFGRSTTKLGPTTMKWAR